MKSTDNTPAAYGAIRKGVYSAFYKGVRPLQQQQCFAINLNGSSSYGQFASRLHNPDGDNTYEFWTPAVLSGSQMIITQTNQATLASSEFRLFTNGGQLRIVRGGTETTLVSSGLQAFTRYVLTQIGNAATVTQGETVIASVTALSGAAREPSAPTRLGVRSSGGSLVNFFAGLFPDVRINGNYYPLDAKGQAIQNAVPDNGNPLTLFNTVPDQWEQVSCGLRSPLVTDLLDETILNDETPLY